MSILRLSPPSDGAGLLLNSDKVWSSSATVCPSREVTLLVASLQSEGS